MSERFKAEALRVSKLTHPNTVTVYSFGETADEQLFLVMELLRGETLAQRIEREGKVSPSDSCRIAAGVAGSLAEAHAKGIIHRDIKPENIFLASLGGEPDQIKVLDFGISKAIFSREGPRTTAGTVLGTPYYSSPEQLRALPLDGRSDLYSLGCVLFEMVTGQPPYSSNDPVKVALAQCQDPPPDPDELVPSLPSRLKTLLMSLLEKDPSRRPSPAEAVKSKLESLLPHPSEEMTASVQVFEDGGGHMPAPVTTRPTMDEWMAMRSTSSLKDGQIEATATLEVDAHEDEEADTQSEKSTWADTTREKAVESESGPASSLPPYALEPTRAIRAFDEESELPPDATLIDMPAHALPADEQTDPMARAVDSSLVDSMEDDEQTGKITTRPPRPRPVSPKARPEPAATIPYLAGPRPPRPRQVKQASAEPGPTVTRPAHGSRATRPGPVPVEQAPPRPRPVPIKPFKAEPEAPRPRPVPVEQARPAPRPVPVQARPAMPQPIPVKPVKVGPEEPKPRPVTAQPAPAEPEQILSGPWPVKSPMAARGSEAEQARARPIPVKAVKAEPDRARPLPIPVKAIGGPEPGKHQPLPDSPFENSPESPPGELNLQAQAIADEQARLVLGAFSDPDSAVRPAPLQGQGPVPHPSAGLPPGPPVPVKPLGPPAVIGRPSPLPGGMDTYTDSELGGAELDSVRRSPLSTIIIILVVVGGALGAAVYFLWPADQGEEGVGATKPVLVKTLDKPKPVVKKKLDASDVSGPRWRKSTKKTCQIAGGLWLDSKPSGAEVHYVDKRLGTTPGCVFGLARARASNVTISIEGFKQRSLDAKSLRSGKLEVKLEKEQ